MDLGGSEQERNKDDLTPKRPEPQKESCHICRYIDIYVDIIYIDIDIYRYKYRNMSI